MFTFVWCKFSFTFLGCLDKKSFINLCMKFSRYQQSSLCEANSISRNGAHALEVASQLPRYCNAVIFGSSSNFLIRYTVLCFWPNGDGEIRTLDPLLARQVLSQLSYTPIWILYSVSTAFRLMGLSEPYLLSEGLAFKLNGLKWTRTTDLTLIRRAL